LGIITIIIFLRNFDNGFFVVVVVRDVTVVRSATTAYGTSRDVRRPRAPAAATRFPFVSHASESFLRFTVVRGKNARDDNARKNTCVDFAVVRLNHFYRIFSLFFSSLPAKNLRPFTAVIRARENGIRPEPAGETIGRVE